VIRYALDLYPRADPKNGARIRRFANLQAASYRAAANGTGSGQILIRGNSPDAAFVDPEGMQYIRVIEVNTLSADGSTLSGFTETVRGGFYLDQASQVRRRRHAGVHGPGDYVESHVPVRRDGPVR
jgi:hypothetical protein